MNPLPTMNPLPMLPADANSRPGCVGLIAYLVGYAPAKRCVPLRAGAHVCV